MNKYLDTKPDYIKCKSLWDAYDFLAHLKWQYLKAEPDGKEYLYYIDDVQISLVNEEFHEDQWANIRWSYHTEKIELVLKRIENDQEVTYACSSLAYEKNQSDFSIYSFMHEHLLSLPDAEDIVSVDYQNMIPVTRSEEVSMPETACTNDAEEPTLPKAEETKKANPNTVGYLSFKEFKDYMCQDKILNETQMFMRCFNKEIVFDPTEEPKLKMIFRTASTWKVKLFLKNFYEKYSGLDLNKTMTVIKEEWIKECFILSNYIDHFRSLKSDKELWLLAYFLECSSWYGFTSVVTPSKLGLPEDRKAVEYFHLLKIMMDQDLRESGDAGDKGSGENNNSEDNGSDGEDDLSNDGSGGKNDSKESSPDDSDSDASDGDGSEGNKPDEESSAGKGSDGGKTDGESANKNDSYSLDDIINDLKKHGVSNSELEAMKTSLEEAEEYTDPSFCKAIPFDNLSLESFKKNQIDNKTDELFKKISRNIISVENDVEITKCSNRPSYHKYSWKTDARADGIVYPGNKRINGGLTRKFKNSPVVFFDFSGSTFDINQCLNDLAYKFWKEGYTVCIYNSDLVHVVEPGDSSFFRFPSDGGTNTLKSVCKYFESKGVSDEDRNIYAITDGNENYDRLFLTYKRTTVFQIAEGFGKDSNKRLFKHSLDRNRKIKSVKL